MCQRTMTTRTGKCSAAMPYLATANTSRVAANHSVAPRCLASTAKFVGNVARTTGANLVNCLAAWSPDGETLAVRGANGAACLFDTASRYPRAVSLPQAELISDLKWLPDGRRVVMASHNGGEIREYSSGDAELLSTKVLPAWVRPAITDDCGLIGSVDASGGVSIFNPRTSERLRKLNIVGALGITWSPNAEQIAVSVTDAAEIWDLDRNECLRRFEGDEASIIWSPDSARMIVATDGEATIHDARSGKVLHQFDDAPSTRYTVAMRDGTWAAKFRWPRFAWSPNGARVAGLGRVWESETGEISARLPRAERCDNTGPPAWSPDASLLAYCGPGRAVVVANVGWALPTTAHRTTRIGRRSRTIAGFRDGGQCPSYARFSTEGASFHSPG